MAKIKEGMSAPQIREILGRPDDIRTGRGDRGGFSTFGTTGVWCYGTSGHLTFPTLGRVYIDDGDRAQFIWGGNGAPPNPSILPEQELRSLLRIIDTAPSYNNGSLDRIDGESYDPLKLIRVINALQPLGKEKALAAISEYLRVCSRYDDEGCDGLFLILRALFEVPADPGYMPRMLVGAPWPPEPSDRRLIPRFPIWLQDDIPILMVSGYRLAGQAEPVERHVEYFRQHGRIRAKPLVPTDRPIAVPEKLMRSGQWIFSKDFASGESNSGKSMVMTQILKVLRTVYRTNIRFHKFANREGTEADGAWKKIASEITGLDIRWDSSKDRYTFKDGTCLKD